MLGLIASVGKIKKETTSEPQYSITIQKKATVGNKNYYEWFATFVSNTPITNTTTLANYMSGKNRVGVAGGGFHYTDADAIFLSSGYITGNRLYLYAVYDPNYSGSYSYGFTYFDIDSSTTFTCTRIN